MSKNRIITVQDIPITVSEADIDDYICITDMATAKSDSSRAADVIKNWLRNRNTLEFLGTWEQIYNSDFKILIGTCFHMIFITSNSALESCGKSLISNPSQMIQREFSRVDQGPFR